MGGKPFFTKKQKVHMRERRKKKKILQSDGHDTIIPSENHIDTSHEPPTSQTKKRPRDDAHTHDDDSGCLTESTTKMTERPKEKQLSPSSPALELTTKTMDGILYVLMPSDLSAKDAKKFRKDARRQLRDSGQDHAESLEFVTIEEMPSLRNKAKKAKTAKEFPCIKDLLKQKKEMEQLRKEETKLKEKLNMIPETIRAQYVALDCEMVGIGTEGRKSALARVSLVDWNLNVLLDTFVQVPIRVTDFRTHVSGVEPKHIKNQNGAMDVTACREKVAQLIKGKILVGHALTNDFKALMLTHPKDKIRDTAKYRPFQRYGNGKWRARKLRDLVKENLKGKEGFQEGEHDSVQDARATMELFQIVYSQWEKEISSKIK